jgi:hypothetical protein
MARIEAYGLAAKPPAGWDAQIYVRPLAAVPGAPSHPPSNPAGPDLLAATTAGVTRPIAHLANFPLAPDRADFGGGAVETMESGAVFIALIELDPADVTKPLFAGKPIPWPLSADDFSPEQLQRAFDGQAGCQRFFTQKGRAFCVYVVIGSHRIRGALAKVGNQALATVEIL